MGKVLRNAIITLYNAFANYAFYGTKPTLNWGSTILHFGMSATLSNVTISSIKVDGVTQSYSSLSEIDIAEGQSLEVTLDLPSNLYVIDDSTFSVKVSGNTLNTNVQGNSIVEDIDDAQVVISIASVDGDVSIKADGITYVPSDLAFHLDCKNGITKSGSTPTKWTDLIGNKEFVLTNVTEAQGGGMHFNGLSTNGSTAVYSGGALQVAHATSTIEFVIEPQNELKQFTSILFNGYDGGICALCQNITAIKGILTAFTTNGSTNDKLGYLTTVLPAAMSLNIDNAGTRACLVNGAAAATFQSSYYYTPGAHNIGMMAVGCYVNASDGVAFERSDQPLTIKAIRVYSQKLTLAQAQKNYAIDKKRFNLV